MDEWVRAFQSSDPVRKSRGAYATPQTLARPMARLLLRGRVPGSVVDPACGAGGLLVAVLAELQCQRPNESELRAHVERLHGVELDPLARELACLMIWLQAGVPSVTPQAVAERVVTANAITRDWLADEPYDALIMNPPWESLRGHAGADTEELGRDETAARLAAQEAGADGLPPLFSAQGRGDRNLYKAFVELAPHLLSEGGRLVALIPGAWSSDLGTAPLRKMYMRHMAVERWTSFENRQGYFQIDGRYKFGVLTATRNAGGTTVFRTRGFASDASELGRGHVAVRAADLEALGGAAAILPDLVSAQERSTMLRYLKHGHHLFDPAGPFGPVRYERELDMTLDRKLGAFTHVTDANAAPTGDGRWVDRDGREMAPLVEGRMVAAFEFHAKNWHGGAGRTAEWTWSNGHRLGECQPQFLAPLRDPSPARVAICDVTSATNTRTVLATWVPSTWSCGNTAPVIVFESEREALAATAVMNSMVFDWLARRIVSGLHLNRFYLDALVWPALSDETVDNLAALAASLMARSPRYRDLADRPSIQPSDSEYVDAHVAIELAVAQGYRLRSRELIGIFSPDPKDRRGFWRYFASDPHSNEVAAACLDAARRPIAAV
jgi:predicted RNA methylase